MRIMRSSADMFGSYGMPRDQHPHPRLWGKFAPILGFVEIGRSADLHVFDLETVLERGRYTGTRAGHVLDRERLSPQ